MTEQQRIAFDHPCYLGVETILARFHTHGPAESWTVTVDAGYA